MKTTLGGDRLGSGNKQQISMRNYERSTHDMSYVWRSTMASGTLVPFLSELALPGDTFDIDLNVNIMTHPTIGPLFGSFKAQLDVFQVPIRLYNGMLHMNRLGIGLNMSQVRLPQIRLKADGNPIKNIGDNQQINSSCILSYLNIRGLGTSTIKNGAPQTVIREFNAVPLLAYWDIYKNYYANKQEEIGYVIHNAREDVTNEMLSNMCYNTLGSVAISATPEAVQLGAESQLSVVFSGSAEPATTGMTINIDGNVYDIDEIFTFKEWLPDSETLQLTQPNFDWIGMSGMWKDLTWDGTMINPNANVVNLQEFLLTDIDDMRQQILNNTGNSIPITIDENSNAPYNYVCHEGTEETGNLYQKAYSKLSTQEGLGIKTYQSDLFNNWVSTEWIDGTNGINEITSIDTTGGSFNIDTLNLANKVYNMLNRIAISGGTYDDWLDAVYTHERAKSVENPIYMGGLIRELAFEEVVSNATSGDQPLGTLAGRGQMTGKRKGGKIRVAVNEPSYIIGIVSLTPRLDYSQGNKWDMNLKSINDLHKPALDEIGFQELITDQMSWFDTKINTVDESLTFKSAGKQPAWLNYMTNVNQVRGNFAEKDQQMWMTLNRKYEQDEDGIVDLTTYIDPAKYNHIFADTSLDAQNFWTQISCDITARRKMSAKLIPNL